MTVLEMLVMVASTWRTLLCNNGLAEVITWLEELYFGTYDGDMSRADFWQLASIAAIERAIIESNRRCNDDRYVL